MWWAEPEEFAFADQALLASRALQEGKAIIDGGATSTLASVSALEKVGQLNCELYGQHRYEVRPAAEDCPIFTFGNGERKRCCSSVDLQVPLDTKMSTLKLHAIESGPVPILLSIESLRSLGAIIDFDRDQMVLTKVNPKRLIQLERSSTGHQLMPLTRDVYEKSHLLEKPILSLRE